MERAQRILIFQISFSQLKEPLDFFDEQTFAPKTRHIFGAPKSPFGGFLPPIWTICWSNWIISPGIGGWKQNIFENTTLKKKLPGGYINGPKPTFDVFWGIKIPWDLLGLSILVHFHWPALEAPSASHPRLEAFHRPQPGSGAVFGGGQNSTSLGSETPS